MFCEDSLAVVIDGAAGAWANGSYTLDMQLARTHRCVFELPGALAANESVALACTPELASSFGAGATLLRLGPSEAGPCPAPDSGDSGDSACSARYRIEVRTSAAPTDVAVRLAAGNTPLLDQTRSPAYAILQPNGPECGPTCRNATIELTLSPP